MVLPISRVFFSYIANLIDYLAKKNLLTNKMIPFFPFLESFTIMLFGLYFSFSLENILPWPKEDTTKNWVLRLIILMHTYFNNESKYIVYSFDLPRASSLVLFWTFCQTLIFPVEIALKCIRHEYITSWRYYRYD